MADLLLETTALRKEFGGLVAVNDVDFTIERGAIVSLIGPNGAGKTTFFNMITGVYKPSGGRVVFDGADVGGRPPHQVTERGVGRTFQNIRLFKEMTALENVLVGMHARLKGGIFPTILRTPGFRREEREARVRAQELLTLCSLKGRGSRYANSLPYGDQRRLEVARALATEPKLLLLDEPTAGMNPQETADFTAFVERLRTERNLTILLIEHDMKVVMGLSDRVTVLDHGEKISEGPPGQVQRDPRVIEAYLGKAAAAAMEPVTAAASTQPLVLEVEEIDAFYGTIQALRGVSLDVREGEVVTLIGANGAGKSSTLRAINGVLRPRKGKIRFQGNDITKSAPHEIVKLGIAQSPEGRRLFPRMTVVENLEMGAFQRRDKPEIREDMDRVFDLFPRLQERRDQNAGTMSGGEQQMCAIGRALMARPKLLLLDEPSLGLAPIFVERIFEIIEEINKQGVSVLLVEQNALMALEAADRGYVLETGRVVLADAASALKGNERVRKTYLGED